MKIKPLFCFYGGKWRAAPRYPSPEHETIIEPFAGGAGYATRYADRKVVLIDRDPVIAGLWKYLTRVTSAEIRSIPAEVPDTVNDLPICQEAKWLVGFWCNKGASRPMKSPAKWMRSGIRPNSYWGAAIRERIAIQVESIRHWSIIEGSYEQAPQVTASWFIDPPYNNAAGSLYRFQVEDYGRLAQWSEQRQGQVIVCEQDGATWLPFKPFATFKSTPGVHGKSYTAESIWLKSSKT